MGQEQLPKEEVRYILDQRFHVVTTTQELCHRTRNFVRLTGDYLGTEEPLYGAMETWNHHIGSFENQYDKAFTGDCLFGADIVDRIHKQVQILTNSCNNMPLEDV